MKGHIPLLDVVVVVDDEGELEIGRNWNAMLQVPRPRTMKGME